MPDAVTVASINLHCGMGTRGQPFDVEAAILGLDAPVILLQETWSPASGAADPIESAAKAMGAQVLRAPMRRIADLAHLGIQAPAGPGDLGIAILTTLPASDYEVMDLGHIPGDVASRVAQIITIDLPGGGAVRIGGTHLTHRLASPAQLARLLLKLRSGVLPTVIAGDLNMPWQLARLAPGYSPAVRGRTWPAELPLLQLDHILAGPGARAVAGTVLPPAGSDHLPVRADISIRGLR